MMVAELVLLRQCVLPRDIVSPNVFLSQHRFSKAKPTAQRKEWFKWLRSETGLGLPIWHKGKKRAVHVVRVVSGAMRKMDKSNLYGGVKPLEDALITLGWIKDDSEKWCELEVSQSAVLDLSDEDTSLLVHADDDAKVIVKVFDLI